MRIKLENRKLSCLKNEITSNDLYIIIENVNQSHHYEFLFNSEVLVGDFSNNTLVYNLDKILDINIVSLKVLDVNNKFLYMTNALELVRVEPSTEIDKVEFNAFKKRFEKFLDQYYKDQEKVLMGAYSPKTIIEKVDYDDTLLLSKIKATSDNVDKSLLKMRESISQIPDSTKMVDEKISNIKEQIEEELTTFEGVISNQELAFNLLKKDFKSENSIIVKNVETIHEHLTAKISEKHNFQLENINKLSHKFEILKQEFQKIEELVSNYSLTFEQKSKETELIAKNIKLSVDESIKEMKQELSNHDYSIDIHALKGVQNEHKSQLLNMKNVKLSTKTTLDPYIFVMKYNGEFYPYKFSKNFPVGISDENGDIIVHGKAVVQYEGKISVGDYVYGNNQGVAEQYDIGYIVLNILENNLCEVFLK